MTRTLSSVTLSEDIILGGTAGADLLAGVRSTIPGILCLLSQLQWALVRRPGR